MIDYMKCDLDDIVFENRNRAYGSYALRKSYGSNMKKAAVRGLALFLMLMSSPLIADRMRSRISRIDDRVVEMKTIAVEKQEIKKNNLPPPPPPPPPVKKVATIRFVPPVVTEQAETTPPVITPPDLNINIGTKNSEGEKTTSYVAPVAEPISAPPPPEEPKTAKPIVDEDKTFIVVEQMPEYRDGVKAMYQFLADNIRYPSVARENNIEGTVFVGFVIGKDGSINQVSVRRGIGGGCNEEAVRVIKLMPPWKAGKQNGKEVSVTYTIPVKFKLE